MEKETIELVKKMIEDGNLSQEIAEKYCPELKGSGDEKIRKALIDGFTVMKESKNCGKTFSNYNIPVVDILAWLEKQGEPKFKVGNWYQCTKYFFGKGVTFDKNIAYYCAKEGCLQDEYGCHIAIVKDLYDNFKLWTIEDAKDGNVLASKDGNDILIFKNFEDNINFSSYYNIERKGEHYWLKSSFISATKEQRDTLFARMREAGYEWDADAKKLKKVEDEPTWNEEDEESILEICNYLDRIVREDEDNQATQLCVQELKEWLKKSLRPRKPLTNEEIEQAKKEYRDVALSKMDYIPEELTYDNGWDDAISYIKKSLRPYTSLEAE